MKKNNLNVVYYGDSDRYSECKRFDSNACTSALNDIYKCLLIVAVAVVFTLLIRTYVAVHVVVEGTSMETTMMDGDHLLIDKLSYNYVTPEYNDIVVFMPHDDSQQYFIKRIVAVPGDKVIIKDNIIYVNDKKFDDKLNYQGRIRPGIASSQILLNENEYFVIGDNREVSLDSRDASIGPISGSSIIGKVIINLSS